MRKEALISISVLLVVFSGSATVLDSFGVISGEASVESPNLYAAGGDELVLDDEDLSTSGSATNITNGAEEYEFFVLESVSDSAEWYKMEAVIDVELRSEEPGGEEVNVSVSFGNLQDSERSCETFVAVEGDEYEVYSTEEVDGFECVIEEPPEGELELRVEMVEDDEEARINYTGDTKVEVNTLDE